MMAKLQVLLLIVVCFVVYGSARPTVQLGSEGRHISKHDRSSSAKRHADVVLSTELAKMLRSRKRIEVLRKLIAAAEQGGNISVERIMQMPSHKSRHILRKLEQEGGRGIIKLQVMPHADLIPNHRETSDHLLSALNGEHKDDSLRVRVVDHRPNPAPQHMDEFVRRADELRQAALAANTCIGLQKIVKRIPNMRIKVRCKTGPPQRRSIALPKPVGLNGHGSTRQHHINGHGQWPRLNGHGTHGRLNGHRRNDGLSRRNTRRYRSKRG